MKEIFSMIFIFLLGITTHAQKIYYKTFEGLVLTEENYLANKKEIEEREDLAEWVYEIPIKTEVKDDSIIKHVKFEVITATNLKGEKIDPFRSQRKMIGVHFPIEKFKDKDGNYFQDDYLKGKPSVVNFWFTDCPPCISEIPHLYKLKKEFGDSVNFIAVTFEKKRDVDKFLEKYVKFNYFHVTNATKPINKLQIQSYPITFLLNEKGETINIYGDLTFHIEKITELLLRLL